MTILEKIRSKIQGLIEDFIKSDIEIFTYTNSNIFTLTEEHIDDITKVLKNGIELETSEYDYDATTNKLTITLATGDSFSVNDIIEVDYTFYKYSNTELNKYIEASLTWISIFSSQDDDYELDDENIYPNPDNKTTDLIAIISSILINPEYSQYRLPNLTVIYPKNMSKEDRIQKIISRFDMGLGICDIITYE